MRYLVYILFICAFTNRMEAQENFQKIYLFEDTFAIFNDVFVTDSCYYYTCTSGSTGTITQHYDFNFGKIKFDGSENVLLLDSDPSSLQYVMFSSADMDTNFRGNFVTNFKNVSEFGTVPRLKEITPNGVLVADYTLNNYWLTDSLLFNIDFCRIQINNPDSSYYLFHPYYDYTTDNNGSDQNGSTGAMLIKLKYDGTVLWDKKFCFTPLGIYQPSWTVLNFIKISPIEFLLVINEYKSYGPSQYDLDWTKTHFIKIDENGNEIDHDVFQDGQFCYGGLATMLLPDGGLIYSYYESILGGSPPNTDYFMPRPVIARLDNNHNLVWKKTIRELYGTDFSFYDQMVDLKLIQDSLFVGSFQYFEEVIPNEIYSSSLRLSQYNLDGINKWHRDYNYFPVDSINDASYSINDLEITPDGGFIMVGEVYNVDSLYANKPHQYGYILKTNCLGFLGSPEAALSYTIGSSDSVEFVNESLQAGSYIWCFGDGDTLVTGEQSDTVSHVYMLNGIYDGKLIAMGCNGEADTSYFTITIDTQLTDTVFLNGNYFTIFPNPSEVDESFSVYLGNVTGGNVQLVLQNEIGQIVQKYNLDSPNTTYIIQSVFASGLYTLSLFDDGKMLEVEKLIIK